MAWLCQPPIVNPRGRHGLIMDGTMGVLRTHHGLDKVAYIPIEPGFGQTVETGT